MTNIKFLLIGTSLSLIPNLTFAQCVATQDCETLGYTETSCNGGKGVKCPFGNKWACLVNEEDIRNKLCQELGFTLTCTGTGYAGGAGSACGEKYTQCLCENNYEWKNGACQKKEVLNGPDGEVYKCNGAVVGIKTSDINFYIALKDIGTMSWAKANEQCREYSFCGNIKGVLPAQYQLSSIYNNKQNINNLLTKYNGTTISGGWYWAAASVDGSRHSVNMSTGETDWDYGAHIETPAYPARPILSSW